MIALVHVVSVNYMEISETWRQISNGNLETNYLKVKESAVASNFILDRLAYVFSIE